MPKMTKNALKEIVKECLVEILTEGLSSPGEVSALKESVTRSKKTNKRRAPVKNPALDTIKFGNAVNETVGSLTDDPVMASIFQDTASTTLQEQLGADQPGHRASIMAQGDSAAKMAAASDPSDLFGGAANNWASIAFAGMPDAKQFSGSQKVIDLNMYLLKLAELAEENQQCQIE